ncbi:Panacea domain-containing protein [Parabacteroides leei]|uniref:Panacea domain-containing protein n=1 Tax=Parabacteroides leei TaxID=2939491 RepID=UPI00189C4C8A|nr:Panacea domain-containing protein [Parabacteroides goldsteinii]
MCLGIAVNKDKIGNLLALLATRLKPLYQTKMIKMVYLIDELKVKDNGVPLTWLDYKVWQFGPVAPELYYLRDNNTVFSNYVGAVRDCNGTLIVPKQEFNKSKFSARDMRIIEEAIRLYGNMNAEELVDLTHGEGSLWSITKDENNIDFSSQIANTSNISMNLSRLIDDDEKLDNYYGAKDTMMFKSELLDA